MVPPCWCGGNGCCHGDAKCAIRDRVVGWCVGESSCCGRVVHPGIRETGVRQGGQGSKRSFQCHSGVTKGCKVRT